MRPGRVAEAVDGLQAMLRGIEEDVAFTRRQIGKDRLDECVMAAKARNSIDGPIPECLLSDGETG